MSDYISKETIQHIIMQERSDFSSYSTIVDKIWRRIKTFPSADVRENIHGEWIFYDEEFYQQGRFASIHHRIRECSICHYKLADFCGNMDFCPNCGADMRGEK